LEEEVAPGDHPNEGAQTSVVGSSLWVTGFVNECKTCPCSRAAILGKHIAQQDHDTFAGADEFGIPEHTTVLGEAESVRSGTGPKMLVDTIQQ
jgi:hypothetical protein